MSRPALLLEGASINQHLPSKLPSIQVKKDHIFSLWIGPRPMIRLITSGYLTVYLPMDSLRNTSRPSRIYSTTGMQQYQLKIMRSICNAGREYLKETRLPLYFLFLPWNLF